MARDRASEIAAVRSRAQWRNSQSVYEVDSLGRLWDEGRGPLGCAPDYAVIRLVTLVEVFMRHRSAELIDAGSPYLERAQALISASGFKIDFPLAAAISGKKISLGDLVAHTLPCNSFGDFVNCFTKLLDFDLIERIANIHDRVDVEIHGKPKIPIISDVKKMRSAMTRLFEARHILVHELPDTSPIEDGDIELFIEMTKQILHATHEYLDHCLHGDYPLTQFDMNVAAAERAAEAGEKLTLLLERIRQNGIDEYFERSQSAWEAYREAEADFRTDWDAGGSIRPMLYAGFFEDLTRERVETLESYLAGQFSLTGPDSPP